MFEQVRLISFDLDDTLWPCRPVIRAAEAECYQWLAREAPRLTERYTPEALREHRLAVAATHTGIAHDVTAVRLRSLTELLASQGYAASAAEAACEVFRRARNRVRPYADVIESLERLRPRYRLVSVTNGNAQIDQTPLRGQFHLSLTAAEVGAAKPDPRIFQIASERSGIPLTAFLHVGDDPHRDVAAARAIGLKTAWVNRAGLAWPERVARADIEVGDITALCDRLIG